MKIAFYLKNAAVDNTAGAQLREATRMGIFAWAFHQLGNNVSIYDVSDDFKASDRWAFFRPLFRCSSGYDMHVVPSESLTRRQHSGILVGIKCAVRARHEKPYPNYVEPHFDEPAIAIADLVVAHEHHPSHDGKVLPVPFLVHDRVIEYLLKAELLDAYCRDNVDVIREHFAVEKTGVAGCCGAGHYGRIDCARPMGTWC